MKAGASVNDTVADLCCYGRYGVVGCSLVGGWRSSRWCPWSVCRQVTQLTNTLITMLWLLLLLLMVIALS